MLIRAVQIQLFSRVSQNYNLRQVVPFPRAGHIYCMLHYHVASKKCSDRQECTSGTIFYIYICMCICMYIYTYMYMDEIVCEIQHTFPTCGNTQIIINLKQ